MKIYTDEERRCHISDPQGTFQEFDVPFFDGKCQTFLEGYRYCPLGESYTRADGEVFHGECIVPWKPYSELAAAQREYEKQKLLKLETNQIELNTSYTQGVNSI